MNFFKSHFWYNKNQRNGILFLVLLIFILQFIYFFVDFSSDKEINIDTSELNIFQQQIDSLKEVKKENEKTKIFPFNPNYITDFKGYQLGMSVEEIDKLLAFRKTGKFVNSNEEFQNITGINDSLLMAISTYFKFPDWVNSKKDKENLRKSKNTNLSKQEIRDLNLVTVKELILINGIGDKLSKRIIDYRELLKGFSFNEQLYEVYFLDTIVANNVLNRYQVLNKPKIEKLEINSANFKEVLHLPYIDYDLTKKIFNYRDEIGAYSTLEDLKKIDSFPLEKYDRIALYLTTD